MYRTYTPNGPAVLVLPACLWLLIIDSVDLAFLAVATEESQPCWLQMELASVQVDDLLSMSLIMRLSHRLLLAIQQAGQQMQHVPGCEVYLCAHAQHVITALAY